MLRALAPLHPAPAVAPHVPAPAPEPTSAAARVSLEPIFQALVRRIAWSGDRRTARIELGAGALAGAVLTVHADAGEVRVSLEVPPGVDAAAWRERIAARLAARRVQVAALDVG